MKLFIKVSSQKSILSTATRNARSQIGGILRENGADHAVHRPFVGVLAGVLYNGVRPLDLAAAATSTDSATKRRGRGASKPHGDVR